MQRNEAHFDLSISPLFGGLLKLSDAAGIRMGPVSIFYETGRIKISIGYINVIIFRLGRFNRLSKHASKKYDAGPNSVWLPVLSIGVFGNGRPWVACHCFSGMDFGLIPVAIIDNCSKATG
jgi:hypothetical protein